MQCFIQTMLCQYYQECQELLLLLLKTKSLKIAPWPGFLASGKDSRTKVVLARKLEKQGLGITPVYMQNANRNLLTDGQKNY